MITKPENLRIVAMDKLVRITAIADNDDEANAHMEDPSNNDGVILVIGPLVFMADNSDLGTPWKPNFKG